MKVYLVATERLTGRTFRFSRIWVCTEYDSICFTVDEADCKQEYQHLAGESFLPSQQIEDYCFEVVTEDARFDESE